jgi:hypothetical protein
LKTIKEEDIDFGNISKESDESFYGKTIVVPGTDLTVNHGEGTEVIDLDDISDNDLALPAETLDVKELGPFKMADKKAIVQPSEVTFSNFA